MSDLAGPSRFVFQAPDRASSLRRARSPDLSDGDRNVRRRVVRESEHFFHTPSSPLDHSLPIVPPSLPPVLRRRMQEVPRPIQLDLCSVPMDSVHLEADISSSADMIMAEAPSVSDLLSDRKESTPAAAKEDEALKVFPLMHSNLPPSILSSAYCPSPTYNPWADS